MSGEEPKTMADPSPATTRGNGTANNVSQGKTITVSGGGSFVRAGYLERDEGRIKLVYEVFGEHIAYIETRGLKRLQDDRMPADVVSIRTGIDEAKVTETIGTAWRSRSGKALMVSTMHTAGGELVCTWASFIKVLEGSVKRGYLSRIERPAATQERKGSGIREGLESGF